MTNTNKLQCPHCGCTPKNGFDLVEHEETSDDIIRDVYYCPKCGKTSIRCYKFVKWDSPKPKKVGVAGLMNTNVSSLPKELQKW